MQIQNSNYSIGELITMLDRRELRVNREYQRGAGLWPSGPRSYFIDTIMSGFPFPKIYLYETYDRIAKTVKKEIVDGQQRICTIDDFSKGKFAISGESKFSGLYFSDLDDEQTQIFMSCTVSCDVIRNATRGDILEMFRRMNAYTLPLNEAEKRHSSFYGEFKWYINSLTDNLGEFLAENTFTNRQIVRMADAELISDITLAMIKGVTSTSPSDLRNLYKQNDESFDSSEDFRNKILSQFRIINERLPEVTKSYMMKPYSLYSLIISLIHLNHNIPEISRQIPNMARPDIIDWENSQNELLALARAHETKDLDGPHERYVWGCSGGTNRAPRRLARMQSILAALGFTSIPDTIDGITINA